MKTLTFANKDTMPHLGLGTWKSESGEVGAAVQEAINVGYRHIDCAAIYGNEAEIGEALAETINHEVDRKALWVTSKLWNSDHKAGDVEPALRKTLSDLKLDYLDLYLMHWPVALKPSVGFPESADDFLSLDEAPLSATWEAMEACVRKGLCRHIGVSNFGIANLKRLMEKAATKPEMNQVELHPLLQQKELLDFCREQGIHATAYSPLGSMDRPDDFKKENEPVPMEHPVIKNIADAHEASPAQILIAWALHRDTAVIPKSVKPEHIRANFEAAEIELSGEELSAIAGLDRSYRFIDGNIWEQDGSPYTTEWLWRGNQ